MTIYTTVGSVRGTCGHKHRTLKRAYLCMASDSSACRKMGGYSDRHIERVFSDHNRPLTPAEDEWVSAYESGEVKP